MPPRKKPTPSTEPPTPEGLVHEAIAVARARSDWRGLLNCAQALRAYGRGDGPAADIRAALLDDDDAPEPGAD